MSLPSNAISTSPSSQSSNVELTAIKEAKGNIGKIRLLLRGDLDLCCSLFEQAVKKTDALSQIHLARAYDAMTDDTTTVKDFSSLTEEDLQKGFCPDNFARYHRIYSKVFQQDDWDNKRASKIYEKTAEQGYLPALLELKQHQWGRRAQRSIGLRLS